MLSTQSLILKKIAASKAFIHNDPEEIKFIPRLDLAHAPEEKSDLIERISAIISRVPPSSGSASALSSSASASSESLGVAQLLKENKAYSLNEMEKCFTGIKQLKTLPSLTASEKITLEEYQLTIMQSIWVHLQQRFTLELPAQAMAHPSRISAWQIMKLLFLVVFDIIGSSLGGFLGIHNFFTDFIPQVSTPVTYAIGAVLCGFDCVLAFSIMKSFIYKTVGITPNHGKSLASVHAEQLRIAKLINHALRSDTRCYPRIKSFEYQRYKILADDFNDYLFKVPVGEFREQPLKGGLKILLILVLSLMTLANGYFVFNNFMLLVAGGIAGATLGHVILVVFLVGQLVSRIATRLRSIHEMLYSSAPKQAELKNEINALKDPRKDFEFIYAKKLLEEKVNLPVEGKFSTPASSLLTRVRSASSLAEAISASALQPPRPRASSMG